MAQPHTDWSLIEQITAGDDRAFDALMERYKRPIVNFVFRIIGDAAEADDAAQEVFLHAYQTIRKDGFQQGTAKFSTWLFQIARNAAIDCLRRRKRRPTVSLSSMEEDGRNMGNAERTADREIAAKEIGEQIAAAIALLPEDQKTAIILSEYENLSYAEIAAIMKSSLKAVELRLYRARQFLRKRLAHLLD